MDRREAWRRELACCKSEPQCGYCPLLPANANKSLHDLIMESLSD